MRDIFLLIMIMGLLVWFAFYLQAQGVKQGKREYQQSMRNHWEYYQVRRDFWWRAYRDTKGVKYLQLYVSYADSARIAGSAVLISHRFK
jgi:hypothetical protein